jgi:hypothetical protein
VHRPEELGELDRTVGIDIDSVLRGESNHAIPNTRTSKEARQ